MSKWYLSIMMGVTFKVGGQLPRDGGTSCPECTQNQSKATILERKRRSAEAMHPGGTQGW